MKAAKELIDEQVSEAKKPWFLKVPTQLLLNLNSTKAIKKEAQILTGSDVPEISKLGDKIFGLTLQIEKVIAKEGKKYK